MFVFIAWILVDTNMFGKPITGLYVLRTHLVIRTIYLGRTNLQFVI